MKMHTIGKYGVMLKRYLGALSLTQSLKYLSKDEIPLE
jgi:hypothetical protein